MGSGIRLEAAGAVDVGIERECNQLSKKTHGRGQKIHHSVGCLVENPVRHF
jgi:hypothetical protein